MTVRYVSYETVIIDMLISNQLFGDIPLEHTCSDTDQKSVDSPLPLLLQKSVTVMMMKSTEPNDGADGDDVCFDYWGHSE